MGRVLIVDDEPALLFALDQLLRRRGHETVQARSAAEGLARLDEVDLVVTDYAMPGKNGLELLREIRQRSPHVPVIVLTAQGSERVAVAAMKSGAYDYVAKPFDNEELLLTVERGLEASALRAQNARLSAECTLGRHVVAASEPMRRLVDLVHRVAPRDVTVLVRGETGSGKELIASLLHAASRRAARPFVRFNCAAIPEELAESELFGHTRGAFTGAVKDHDGFFAEANGGTLVLDEVGELPLGVQGKLLRALQDGEIQRVGAGRAERMDVRVVACTNRDLAAEARGGRFREDLYYRLAVVELVVPPLRDHREDIPALAAEFTRRYAERFGVEDARLAPGLVAALQRADWPGNIRQLENAIARLVALSPGGLIDLQALDVAQLGRSSGQQPVAGAAGVDEQLSLREQVEALERGIITRTLAAVGGNRSEAARRLGLSRSAFLERLRKLTPTGLAE